MVADLDHMKIGSMGIAPIEAGIGQMMEPITHAEPLIDLCSDCQIRRKLEMAPHILIGKAVLAEECASSSDF